MTIADQALTHFAPYELSTGELSVFAKPPAQRAQIVFSEPSDVPKWIDYLVKRLNELARIDYSWPDELLPPSFELLQGALKEASLFMPTDCPSPSVLPTPEGNVQFVWHKGGRDIEVDFTPTETTVWVRDRTTGTTWDGALGDRKHELFELLEQISDQP